MSQLFQHVTPHPVEASTGPCELPILYRDGSLVMAMWRVDPEAAQACLPRGLTPLQILGKAIAALACFEYRETSIGSYGEIGLAILACRSGATISALRLVRDVRAQEDQALHVVSLPVTTDAACAAGKELWGYPKYVTGIDTDFQSSSVRIRLAGELELTMGRSRGPRMRAIPFITFSVLEDRLIRTVIETDAKGRWGGARTARVRLLGRGPTADRVRELGIADRPAGIAFRTDGLRAVLPAGRDLGPLC